MTIPRSEHPRPDFMREDWLSLNGEWQFEVDGAASGEDRRFFERPSLAGKILLPFCPESELSGIGCKDFMPCVWYRREVEIPAAWAGKRVRFHIGACDYRTKVWANGVCLGTHTGGYTPFFFDITDAIRDGRVVLTVAAWDDTRPGGIARGKQSNRYESYGCLYTRTTGIWQTVWLEAVDPAHITFAKYTADIEQPSFAVQLGFSEAALGCRVSVTASYEGREVGRAETTVSGKAVTVALPLSERHLWEPGQGRLYDLSLSLTREGKPCDTVTSYAGLRAVALAGRKFLINGKSVFQRLVLDQGFYPDGIYTAPTEEALKHDIEMSMAFGFNGARLHQKVFEPRFLYWCDKLGYLVWGEYANWGMRFQDQRCVAQATEEFLESVERDFNHPSIIGWCPLNEVWEMEFNPFDRTGIRLMWEMAVKADPTRVVIDSSGGCHVCGPVYDIHDYNQDPAAFGARMDHLLTAPFDKQTPFMIDRSPRENEPVFVSEFGGIGWMKDGKGWGYGDTPKTEEELITRFEGLTGALLRQPYLFGYCYTQLYDVEQECNGLLCYDRTPKFDPARFYAANTRKAAIED